MDELEVAGDFDLNQTSIEDLVSFLHEHSINTVAIAARHTHFGTVEKAIQACEVEGVETWLMADFFQTQYRRQASTISDGRPVLAFHSGPETRWPLLVKQIKDIVGGDGRAARRPGDADGRRGHPIKLTLWRSYFFSPATGRI